MSNRPTLVWFDQSQFPDPSSGPVIHVEPPGPLHLHLRSALGFARDASRRNETRIRIELRGGLLLGGRFVMTASPSPRHSDIIRIFSGRCGNRPTTVVSYTGPDGRYGTACSRCGTVR